MTRASHIDHHEMTERSCTSRIYSTICWPPQNVQYLLLDEQYLYGDDRRVEHPLHLYVCLFGWVFILLLYPENRECIEARKPTAIKERWGGASYLQYIGPFILIVGFLSGGDFVVVCVSCLMIPSHCVSFRTCVFSSVKNMIAKKGRNRIARLISIIL